MKTPWCCTAVKDTNILEKENKGDVAVGTTRDKSPLEEVLDICINYMYPRVPDIVILLIPDGRQDA